MDRTNASIHLDRLLDAISDGTDTQEAQIREHVAVIKSLLALTAGMLAHAERRSGADALSSILDALNNSNMRETADNVRSTLETITSSMHTRH